MKINLFDFYLVEKTNLKLIHDFIELRLIFLQETALNSQLSLVGDVY